ncbi:MAG: phytanoyl-CoA dioxygenase family protein [Enhydrobacter sp.]|nr:MAG: phytanoyl-CoA dioxygenase family protein [Enhydrobacter sp.]
MTRIDSRDISAACDGLTRQGYALLQDVVAAEKFHALHRQFNSRYAHYLRDVEYEETLKVGDRRYRVPVELAGGFADPDVWANATVLDIVRGMLGDDAILDAFGAVVSLPGAAAQHVHRDSPLLFDAAIAPLLPCHALTLALPLVDMDETRGTTALWPGSHRWKARAEGPAPETPRVPAGACLLWDYRLFHGGTPNRSAEPRPMLYATYARAWYRDPTGFTRQGLDRLAMPAGFLDGLPPERRRLFSHLA